MSHALLAFAVPFDPARAGAVRDALGPFQEDAEIKRALDDAGFVHFLSMTVIEANEKDRPHHLFIEVTADGSRGRALERLTAILDGPLGALLAAAGRWEPAPTLTRYEVRTGPGWFSQPGLAFDGTPRKSVERIRREDALSRQIGRRLDQMPPSASALDRLEAVRAWLWSEKGAKWAFEPEPAPMLHAAPPRGRALRGAIAHAIRTLAWPLLLVPLLVLAAALAMGAGLALALWFLLFTVGLEALLAVAVFGRLRALEEAEIPDDVGPDSGRVARMLAAENADGSVQNHLAAQSKLKPGRLRRMTLRVGFWFAGTVARFFSAPGFLATTGSIHFAQWVLLPRTDTLVFVSNYDGAWQSYIEEFIERSALGVTGIWSNTRGFPRTRGLFGEGATDGDRLLRWIRRQQHPALYWYQAYPHLTRARIRLNAAIRQGVALARTETEARDWLACFGSAPKPADSVEAAEIPTLAFGGLGHLRFGTALMLRLPPDPRSARDWLASIRGDLTYGDSRWADKATVAGFTAPGLRRLGMSPATLSTFPVAFQHGAAQADRARALGDRPDAWAWGQGDSVDAGLMLYDADDAAHDARVDRLRRGLAEKGGAVVAIVPFEPLPARVNGRRPPVREPFGFVDGISQPVVRGLRRGRRDPGDIHMVEPGEFVLGYADNRGYLPPSPSIAATLDPGHRLATAGHDPFRPRPNFAEPQPVARHDLGRNGTFLVMRTLAQDVEGFDAFLGDAARRLAADDRFAMAGEAELKEWISAKMVGRWPNGASLVRHARAPANGAAPDNDFLFGQEDPDGVRCPFGAHVRRTNPRDSFDPSSDAQIRISNRHRILRVGRNLAPEGRDRPGIAFMCLCASIERQFEFIQQVWMQGRSFHALSDEIDPITGQARGSDAFTIPMPDGPFRLGSLRDFTQVEGGAYLFLPGRRTVDYLAAAPA